VPTTPQKFVYAEVPQYAPLQIEAPEAEEVKPAEPSPAPVSVPAVVEEPAPTPAAVAPVEEVKVEEVKIEEKKEGKEEEEPMIITVLGISPPTFF